MYSPSGVGQAHVRKVSNSKVSCKCIYVRQCSLWIRMCIVNRKWWKYGHKGHYYLLCLQVIKRRSNVFSNNWKVVVMVKLCKLCHQILLIQAIELDEWYCRPIVLNVAEGLTDAFSGTFRKTICFLLNEHAIHLQHMSWPPQICCAKTVREDLGKFITMSLST